jgi:hypothetical protein
VGDEETGEELFFEYVNKKVREEDKVYIILPEQI